MGLDFVFCDRETPPEDAAFFMVWSPQGGSPTFKHLTEKKARAEAERLARAHRNSQFFVLQAIAMKRYCDIQTVELNSDEIPI